MAEHQTINLTTKGQNFTFTKDVSKATAEKTSILLQRNHKDFHTFFNYHEITGGIFQHNHIVHHALTLFALGASPELAEQAFEVNAGFQRAQPQKVEAVYKKLGDLDVFKLALGNEYNYANFLHYFETYLGSHGFQETFLRFMFARDEFAEEVFSRQFLGFVHPLIHTMAGFEFSQPAIVAEGFAQACVHRDEYLLPVLFEIEKRSNERKDHAKTLVEILDACRKQPTLMQSVNYNIFDKLKNGVIAYAHDEIVEMASRWKIEPHQVDLKMAELQNAAAFMVAGAQRKGKEPRMDFFTMHGTNAAIFISAMVRQSWISAKDKARTLSWFGAFIIIAYVVHGSPELDLTVARELKPTRGPGGWDDAIRRSTNFMDDGHACKLVRSLAWAEKACQQYENEPGFFVRGDDYVKAAASVVESLQEVAGRSGPDMIESWIRGAGFDEAWANVPDLAPMKEAHV